MAMQPAPPTVSLAAPISFANQQPNASNGIGIGIGSGSGSGSGSGIGIGSGSGIGLQVEAGDKKPKGGGAKVLPRLPHHVSSANGPPADGTSRSFRIGWVMPY